MGVHGACFFHPGANERLAHDLALLPASPSSRCALLSGPSRSGRTSLLLQLAYGTACKGCRVLFICQPKSILNPPVLPEGITRSASAYDNIDMRYLQDDDELRLFFASFHMITQVPEAVIVDNFSEFFMARKYQGDRRACDIAQAKTLALMFDATQHAGTRLDSGECKLVVSDLVTESGYPRSSFIFQRWLPLTFLVSASSAGEFRFSVFNTDAVHDTSKLAIYYSLSRAHLVLERIEARTSTE
mmetsp:Transcript_20419/g.39107  ORF Transcript_20419/g.39107 Transcript_20419/m.39107 type:complete len:244 (-) Transcript_20419:201-932(-)